MRFPSGEHTVTVACPSCEKHVDVDITLEGVLKSKEFGGATLSVALSAKALPHDCAVEQLAIDAGTGEVLG